uniref:Uncharacterized protein n=1 Tax=Oryza brachyantha TaxID=4533 RepID=J3MS17_ORYBR
MRTYLGGELDGDVDRGNGGCRWRWFEPAVDVIGGLGRNSGCDRGGGGSSVRLGEEAVAAASGWGRRQRQQDGGSKTSLAHFDGSLCLAYAGGKLGFVYIPVGLIDGGRTKDMSASFAVLAFASATPASSLSQEMVATSCSNSSCSR